MAGMRARNLVILAVITLVIITAAVVASLSRAPQSGKEKTLLFPELKDTINNTSEVIIRGQDRAVTLLKQDGRWVVQQADGYPADFEKLKPLLVGMTALRIVEEKTSTPELYPRLGVEDPDDPNASSHLLVLKDDSGQTLAELIVGKSRRDPASADGGGLYVRPPDQAQSLLVEGQLTVSSQITDWFDQHLFNIKPDRIESIVIRHPDGDTVTVSRDEPGDDFNVEPMPEGRKPQSELILTRMSTILENTFAVNVTSRETFTFPEDHVNTTILTFDGLVAEARAVRQDDRNYVAFRFIVDESRVSTAEEEEDDSTADIYSEAEKYNDVVSGWVFTLPDHRFDLLTRTLNDLTRPE